MQAREWLGETMRIVIVGTSAASYSTLVTLRESGFEGAVTCISRDTVPFYSRIPLPDIISGRRDLESLAIGNARDVQPVVMMMGRDVEAIRPANREVVLSGGRTVAYDRLVLCPGASAKMPPGGISGPGVFTLRNSEDAFAIKAWAAGSRRALIVGGGQVSLKTAAALRKTGIEVQMVVKSSRILSQMLDNDGAAIVADVLIRNGVSIRAGRDVVAVERRSGRPVAALLDDGSSAPCDMVIYGKGTVANTAFLGGSGVETRRGIITNGLMETSVPGIYAAGDVVEAPDFFYAKLQNSAIWPEAVRQGQVAAHAIMGIDDRYEGSIPRNVSEVFGLPFASVGLTEQRPGCEVVSDMMPGRYVKAVFEDGRLMGAIMVGNVNQAGIIQWLIRSRRQIRPGLDVFSLPHLYQRAPYLQLRD
ncbi:MAG: NAD(P)/FAD-dependent oxidoreductase [Bacillota bacterium]